MSDRPLSERVRGRVRNEPLYSVMQRDTVHLWADEIAALEQEIKDRAETEQELGKWILAVEAERDRLRDALRNIAIAPCLLELLGEGDECADSCPGCRARAVLEGGDDE